MTNIFLLAAAMHKRPYVLNEGAPPPGYWANLLNGPGMSGGWTPLPHRVERKSAPLADCLGWVGGVPLFSSRAMEILLAVEPRVKFCPFGDIKGRPYWIIGSVPAVDALDIDRSEVNRGPTGEISSLKSAALDRNRLASAPPIFCLPGRAHCELFVKEAVPAAVVAAGLTGFQFSDPSKPQLKRIYLGKDINVFPGVMR